MTHNGKNHLVLISPNPSLKSHRKVLLVEGEEAGAGVVVVEVVVVEVLVEGEGEVVEGEVGHQD